MTNVIGPPAEHILEEEVGDDIVLYDPKREQFFELNETASDVWRLATGEFTLDGIVEKLAAAYQVDPDVVRDDVGRVIEMMIGNGLLAAPALE